MAKYMKSFRLGVNSIQELGVVADRFGCTQTQAIEQSVGFMLDSGIAWAIGQKREKARAAHSDVNLTRLLMKLALDDEVTAIIRKKINEY